MPWALCWPGGCCATFPHSQTLSKTQLGFVVAILLEIGAEEALETQQHPRGGQPRAPQAFRQQIPLQIPPLEIVRSLALLPQGEHLHVCVYSSTLGCTAHNIHGHTSPCSSGTRCCPLPDPFCTWVSRVSQGCRRRGGSLSPPQMQEQRCCSHPSQSPSARRTGQSQGLSR